MRTLDDKLRDIEPMPESEILALVHRPVSRGMGDCSGMCGAADYVRQFQRLAKTLLVERRQNEEAIEMVRRAAVRDTVARLARGERVALDGS